MIKYSIYTLVSSLFLLVSSSFALTNSQAIESLRVRGIVESRNDYELDRPILRQEILALMVRVRDVDWQTGEDCHSRYYDVTDGGDWVCAMTEAAADDSLISSSNSYLRPTQEATLLEVLAFLYGPELESCDIEQPYSEYISSPTSDWQKRLILLAIEDEFVSDFAVDIDSSVSRGQAFRWLTRVVQQNKDYSCRQVADLGFYFDYIDEPKSIRIDTFSEAVKYYEYGKYVDGYSASTGDWDHQTPIGKFQVMTKHEHQYSKSADLWMPYWMEFYNGVYGIHALPTTYSGIDVRDESAIGIPWAGGCVRLLRDNAREIYEWAELGTTVLIDYRKTY